MIKHALFAMLIMVMTISGVGKVQAQGDAGLHFLEVNQKGTFNFLGICREITNNSSERVFIPHITMSEYGSFLANPPPDVIIEPCCSVLQDKSGYEYEACPDMHNGSKYRSVTVDYGVCKSFDGVYEDETPPAPVYGSWVDNCSPCGQGTGCSLGEDREDFCAEPKIVNGVFSCDRWDFRCNWNCNNTTQKATEQFDQPSADICGNFKDVTVRSLMRWQNIQNYGNATGLNISNYVQTNGSCTTSQSCTQYIQSRQIETCPAGQVISVAGAEQRIMNQGNVCGDNTSFAQTKAPVCVPAPPTAVNGVCGPTNGNTVSSKPNSGLCTSGDPSTVNLDVSVWKWNCNGINGGTSSSCSAGGATPVVGPSCGQKLAAFPTGTDACSVGTASNYAIIDNGKKLYWECAVSGFANTNCTTPRIWTPVCGSANGVSSITAPDNATLCSSGNPVSLTQVGSNWTWQCEGSEVPNISCSTNTVVGTCGTANGTTSTTAPSANLCATGTASTVVDASGKFSWTCNGSASTSPASCEATKNECTKTDVDAAFLLGVMNHSNQMDTISILCPAGQQVKALYSGYVLVGPNVNIAGNFTNNFYTSASAANNAASTYCEPKPVSCGGGGTSEPPGGGGGAPICGTSNGQTFGAVPTNGLCNPGTASAVTTGANYSWTCSSGTASVSCSANKTPVVGVCGSSAGQTFTSAPNTGLCSTGTASAVGTSGSTFNWTCQGDMGTAATSCTATKQVTVAEKTCTWTFRENIDDTRSWCYTLQQAYQQGGLSAFCGGINVVDGETQTSVNGAFAHTFCFNAGPPGLNPQNDYCSNLNSDFTMAQYLECIEN